MGEMMKSTCSIQVVVFWSPTVYWRTSRDALPLAKHDKSLRIQFYMLLNKLLDWD